MRSMLSRGLLVAAVGLGCEVEKHSPEPEHVRVRSVQRYHTQRGVVERPTDFTANPLELFVLEGGTFRPIPGTAVSTEEYEFKDVPDGAYYLKLGNAYTVTSARKVDLSNNLLGRPDQQPLATTPNPLSAFLYIDGLEPWPETEEERGLAELQLVSAEVDVTGSLSASWALPPGSTSVHGESVPYYNISSPVQYRFEQARGDRAWVNQLMPRTAGTLADGRTLRYSTVVRSLHLPPFSFDGDEPLHVSGTFQPLPLKELSLDWRLSAFAAHAAAAHPDATRFSASFFIMPAAHGLEPSGWVGYSGELLTMRMPDGYAQDFSGRLSYGNPFPSTWVELASGSVSFRVDYTVPGAASPLSVSASLSVTDKLSALSAGPLQPRLLPPRDMMLDGEQATVSRPLALGGHVISWQPPASGEVSAYRLRLLRYQVENGRAARKEIITFAVGADITSVRLPDDVLKPEGHYLIELSAVSPHYKAEDAGSLFVVPYARGTTLSGLLSTP